MKRRIVNVVTGPGSSLVATILCLKRSDDGNAMAPVPSPSTPPDKSLTAKAVISDHWARVKQIRFPRNG